MDNRPAQHAILGLLKLAGDATYGYDLARHFAPPDPFADILHVRQQTIYQYLKKLAGSGMVSLEVDASSSGPGPVRQLCRLTTAGETELNRWLQEPVHHTRDVQLEFVVKLYFCEQITPHNAASLIEQQISASTTWERVLLGRIEQSSIDVHDFTTDFRRSVLRLRLEQTRSALRWLEGQRH